MKKLITLSLILLLFISQIPTFIVFVKASHSTWYIATTGSDSNPGTISSPFKTLQRAINVSATSDTIYLRGYPYCNGNYNTMYPRTQGYTIDKGGTSSEYLTIAGYQGERVVLNGDGYTIVTSHGVLNIGSESACQSYIRISNLIIENISGGGPQGGDALEIFGGLSDADNHICIDNVTINNCQYHALQSWSDDPVLHPINNITIDHCSSNNTQTSLSTGETWSFHGCKDISFHDNIITKSWKINLDPGNGCRNMDIYNNKFYTYSVDHGSSGIKLDGGNSEGITSLFDSNISIHHNLFQGVFQGIFIQSEHNGGDNNITIYDNIFNISNPTSNVQCISIQDSLGYYQWYSDITIKYNTFNTMVGNCRCFDIVIHPSWWKNIVIANNIFQNNNIGSYIYYSDTSNPSDPCYIFMNNLYNNTVKAPASHWKSGSTTIFEVSAIISTPSFVNRKTGNFHLNATSPAINAATSSYIVLNDYSRTVRPQGPGYDIGAYEYDKAIQPNIGNVMISPNPQQIGKCLNISCNVTDNCGDVIEVRVNITYPDHTTHNYSMNPGYYLNQTYSLSGTYRFFIWAKDTNKNSTISSGHAFQIIPELGRAFLVGSIINVYDMSKSIVSFRAKFLLYLRFNPFSLNLFSSDNQIFISKDSKGYIGIKIIIGRFNATVLSERSSYYKDTRKRLVS
jgi:hypothetical protein